MIVRDSLYAQPLACVGQFCFDEQVAQVFPDMIQRSVPGYQAIIAMLGVFAAHYAQPNTRCYDLGCSLGAASLAMRPHLPLTTTLIAVDNSAAMLVRCRQNLAQAGAGCAVEVVQADVGSLAIENASIVVLNFTLQFVPIAQRLGVLQRIYQGLQPGGVLILSEKICFPDAAQQQRLEHWHHLFKQANGYSELEISQKRSALDPIMQLDSLATHLQRLAEVGFASQDIWFQHLNFSSIIACKSL